MTTVTHKLQDEYMYEDMVMCCYHPLDLILRVKEFQYRPGDVLLATYPKTGTTWAAEMVWLLSNDADFEKANNTFLWERFPFMEIFNAHSGRTALDRINEMTNATRTMKSHLPAQFFPSVLEDNQQKVVVMVRNPKDTLVSLFHVYRSTESLGNFTGTWDEFFEMYKARHMYYGDYFDWHMGWWQHKDKPNVLFVSYERMQTNLKQVILKVAGFLEKSFPDNVIEKMAEHLQFKQMKSNKMTNNLHLTSRGMNFDISPFMRKGEVGDWKNYFSTSQSDYVDRQYRETLEKAGLVLQFD